MCVCICVRFSGTTTLAIGGEFSILCVCKTSPPVGSSSGVGQVEFSSSFFLVSSFPHFLLGILVFFPRAKAGVPPTLGNNFPNSVLVIPGTRPDGGGTPFQCATHQKLSHYLSCCCSISTLSFSRSMRKTLFISPTISTHPMSIFSFKHSHTYKVLLPFYKYIPCAPHYR